MNKKKIVVVISSIVVVLLIGGGALLWAVWRSTPENSSNTSSGTQTPQYSDRQRLVDEVNKKYGEGDFKGAITLIEGQKNSQDVGMQLLLAGAYANSGDIAKAYEIYKKINNEGKLPDSEIVNLAEMAERAGDVKGALEAYRKAKEKATPQTATQDDIAFYDFKIAELEKKQ